MTFLDFHLKAHTQMTNPHELLLNTYGYVLSGCIL